MQHVILFGYIIVFAGGFAGLFALAILKFRIRSPLVTPFIAIEVILLAGLVLVTVSFYLENVMNLVGGTGSGWRMAAGLLSTLINLGLYGIMLRILLLLYTGRARRKILTMATAGAIGAVIFFLCVNAVINIFFTPLPLLGFFIYILTGGAVFLFGASLLGSKLTGQSPAIVTLITGCGLSCLFFLPLGLAEYALDRAGIQPFHPLSLDFIFFLACNAAMIKAALTTFRQPDSPLVSAIPRETAERFGLTAREEDMILLIARGLSNKEIAAQLCISAATVRTHIYNLYRKTQVQSRVELINRIHAKTPSDTENPQNMA